MRLELFDVSRRWPRQRTQSDDEVSFVNSGIFSLPSVQFVGLILPSNSHAEIWKRLHNFFRYLAIGMCHFRYLWNGLCDRHRAEITVIQVTLFRCITLKWDLHLVPYYQRSSPARFLSIIGHWDVPLPLSSEWQVWSSSSGNNYHAVHRSLSSGASLWMAFLSGSKVKIPQYLLTHKVNSDLVW